QTPALRDQAGAAVRVNRLVCKLQGPLPAEIGMDHPKDLGLAGPGKPPDDEVLADHRRNRRLIFGRRFLESTAALVSLIACPGLRGRGLRAIGSFGGLVTGGTGRTMDRR